MDSDAYLQADSLNHEAYLVRYKNLDLSEALAHEALETGKGFSEIKAEALNHLGFCAFIIADTTQIPAIGIPFKISIFSLLSPPIALAGIGTLLQISFNVSVEVNTVLTFVVVG